MGWENMHMHIQAVKIACHIYQTQLHTLLKDIEESPFQSVSEQERD